MVSMVPPELGLWDILDQKQVLGVLVSTLIILLTSIYIVYKKFVISTVMCPCQGRIDGKMAVVTGANSGIGKEVSKELVKRGARVLLACRSIKRANAAATEIRQETGSSEVYVKQLDLASNKSIRKFAEYIKENKIIIDILINNAGVSTSEFIKTEDGFENTFAVNYLGPFLLTNLLLESLLQADAGRIVNVAAHTHVFGRFNFADLMHQENYSTFKAYCQSKLALISFTRQLALLLEDTNVKTYSVHPGMTFTKLRHRHNFFKHLILPYFCRSPKEGAQTIIYCAVAHDVAEETGWYYSNCDISTPIYMAYDEETCKRLWAASAELVGLDQPSCQAPSIANRPGTPGPRRKSRASKQEGEEEEEEEEDDNSSIPCRGNYVWQHPFGLGPSPSQAMTYLFTSGIVP